MTRRLKTAKPTGILIKGVPLSGGGMDDENSEGELRVLDHQNLKKNLMAFAIRWCVLEVFKP